ncbi:MAG: cyclic nucleotide-binding domain-containing protein [Calditrichaeota bacterium]|jgi:CRP/FNR family transcriptional regulator, cyclic AMP receptor protein|nr:cyclic nucleotide-binding domain-containing protein [Calditrichota bacterium]
MASVNRDFEEIKEILANSVLGQGLTDIEVELVADNAVQFQYNKGTRILEEKTESRDLFIIHDGEVSVKMAMNTMHFMEESVARLSEGEIFGEFSFINGEPRSATILAEKKVSLIHFKYDALIKLFEENPRIGYIMIHNLAVIATKRIKENHQKMRKLLLSY